MKFKTEAELCEKFIAAHPRSEHLYFEVYAGGGRCDIVHKENNIVSIYETKLDLNLSLLEQCINRKPYANFVYAVVPPFKRKFFLQQLFNDYGIGIISFWSHTTYTHNWKHWVDTTVLRENITPCYNRFPKKITLYEENKKEIAGSQAAGVTPFSLMVENIKSQLQKGSRPIDYIFEKQSYYGTLKQFKTNISAWIRRDVIKGIGMHKGIMYLLETK